MSEVLQANIFFFVTGIAVIIFSSLLCVALYQLIRILKSIRRVMDRIEAGSEIIAADLENVRSYFAEKSLFSRVIGAILGGGSSRQASEKRSSTPVKKTDRRIARTELKIKDEE